MRVIAPCCCIKVVARVHKAYGIPRKATQNDPNPQVILVILLAWQNWDDLQLPEHLLCSAALGSSRLHIFQPTVFLCCGEAACCAGCQALESAKARTDWRVGRWSDNMLDVSWCPITYIYIWEGGAVICGVVKCRAAWCGEVQCSVVLLVCEVWWAAILLSRHLQLFFTLYSHYLSDLPGGLLDFVSSAFFDEHEHFSIFSCVFLRMIDVSDIAWKC